MGHIDTTLSRRSFLIAAASAAGGRAISVSIPRIAGAAPMTGGAPWNNDQGPGTGEVNAWIVIDPDDTVTIRCAKSEMGEGVFTALPMIVAEELGCDWTKVRSEYASGNRNIRGKMQVYQGMLTGGSSAVRASR